MSHTRSLLALALTACLAACGGSSTEAAGGGSAARITDPAQLPEDEEGLIDVYEALMTQAVETVEGIDSEAALTAGLAEIEKLGPAFAALMKRSEELGVTFDESYEGEGRELADRMATAMRDLFQKFPTRAMDIQNAFTSGMGVAGPR